MAFAGWMRRWADRPRDWNDNLLVLGDFNLDRIGDPLFEAFVSTGLWPPTELNDVPRTVFDNDRAKHFYDEIAWFSDTDGKSLLRSLTYAMHAGSFDFSPHLLGRLDPVGRVLAILGSLSVVGGVPAVDVSRNSMPTAPTPRTRIAVPFPVRARTEHLCRYRHVVATSLVTGGTGFLRDLKRRTASSVCRTDCQTSDS